MPRSCSNCGALYDSLNPFRGLCDACKEMQRRGKSRENVVVLGIVDGDLEANIWVDMLDREGIPAMIRQNDALRGRFQTAPLPYSTEVLVKDSDLEHARVVVGLDRPDSARGGGAWPSR